MEISISKEEVLAYAEKHDISITEAKHKLITVQKRAYTRDLINRVQSGSESALREAVIHLLREKL